MEIFAAFIICREGRRFCATTRDDGSIGLPGGKVEDNETPAAAALREAKEEGWFVACHPVNLVLTHSQTVEGKEVVWFSAPPETPAFKLQEFKEKGRIRPILASKQDLKGMGNPEALKKYWESLGF